MGRFVVSRSAAGDRFTLQTALGYTLAVSRDYATLDACKKGIASLIINAPTVPVRDLTAGERGPNPKFEITGKEGAYVFALKSANGKAVVTSAPYATKKACLRAITMLRAGVKEYEILFEQKGTLVPLVMKLPDATAAVKATPSQPIPDSSASSCVEAPSPVAPTLPEAALPEEAAADAFSFSEEFAPTDEATPTDVSAPSSKPSTMSQDLCSPKSGLRLVRLKPAGETKAAAGAPPASHPKQETPPAKKRGFLGMLFKK